MNRLNIYLVNRILRKINLDLSTSQPIQIRLKNQQWQNAKGKEDTRYWSLWLGFPITATGKLRNQRNIQTYF